MSPSEFPNFRVLLGTPRTLQLVLETRVVLWTVPPTRTVYKKFIDIVSDSTLQLNFKMLSGFSVIFKENITII